MPLSDDQKNLDDTFNTEEQAKKSTRMTQSEGDELSEKLDDSETEGTDEKQETLEHDETVSTIREWLLQEKLIIQELKRFKPVKQPNNPNPPWEYYMLRQRQMIVQLKHLRRRIEFIGKKDEYFIELNKLSQIANRLLELMNRGEWTEYRAAGTSYEDLLREIEALLPEKAPKTKEVIAYRSGKSEEVPEEYQAAIARYFQKLSEE